MQTGPRNSGLLSSVALALLERGERIAAELPAARADHRRFVVVTPFVNEGAQRYRLVRYECHSAMCDEAPSAASLQDFEQCVASAAEIRALIALWAPEAMFDANRIICAPY